TVTSSRTVTLSDPTAPATALQTLTDTFIVNGRTYTNTFVAAGHTITTTSPTGRKSITTLDTRGRVVQQQYGGLAPITYTFESRGRLSSVTSTSGSEVRTQ